MLVGISALTTIGLRRYYAEQRRRTRPSHARSATARPGARRSPTCCAAAGIAQEHTVFAGAAVCAVVAAVLALVLFRTANTRALDAARLLRAAG